MIDAYVLEMGGHEAAARATVRNAEISCVKAGIRVGFQNIEELRVMKYDESMETANAMEWKEAAKNSIKKRKKYRVCRPVKLRDVPPNSKIITSTWEMKNKSNGIYRVRLNAIGCEQLEGLY